MSTDEVDLANICFVLRKQLSRNEEPHRACTDARGQFSISGLSPGTYNVSLDPRSRKEFIDGAMSHLAFPNSLAPVEVDGKEDVEFSVSLERCTVVQGKVVDTDGKPMQVSLVTDSGVCGFSKSDANGEFELAGLEPGQDRMMLIMNLADYGYYRIIRLRGEDMVSGATIRIPEIQVPAVTDVRNVTIRFSFEGDDEWKKGAINQRTLHSEYLLRSEDGRFEAKVPGLGEAVSLILPSGRYLVKEYQLPDYLTANLSHRGPKVVKSPPQEFVVPEEGSVEISVTVAQPPE